MELFIQNYPLAIEPTTAALEVSLSTSAPEGERPHWYHLERLRPTASESPFGVQSSLPHLFGDKPRINDCLLVLAYNPAGVIKEIWTRCAVGHWDRHFLASEITGQVNFFPSIRFLFTSQERLDSFLTIFRRMSDAVSQGQDPCARDTYEFMRLLGDAPARPRVMQVGELAHERAPQT